MVFFFNKSFDNLKTLKFREVLLSIFGINSLWVLKIFTRFGLSKNILISELSSKQLAKIERWIFHSTELISENLKHYNYKCIQQKKDLKTYGGYRHIYKLSVRGQRTKTNCKTQKNKKNF